MIWQDIVIAIINIVFGYSLVYQVYIGFKEKKGFLSLQTSLLTTIGLFVLAVIYLTLNLYISTLVTLITGIFWFLLLVQRLIYKKA